VLIVSGWATPAFNELGRQVRAQGGAVILMIDNRWRGDLRQRLAPIVFNTKYRNWFQAAIVPGKSARRFVRGRVRIRRDQARFLVQGKDGALVSARGEFAGQPTRVVANPVPTRPKRGTQKQNLHRLMGDGR
jgi:hypothetical protein